MRRSKKPVKFWILLAAIGVVTLGAGIARAQRSIPDSIRTYTATVKVCVDGTMDETDWGLATPVWNFTQREPNVGTLASERTEVAILHDQSNLYIGVKCFDSKPAKIVANELKWDFEWGAEDNFEVILDTYGDRRNGYLFVINPNGAQADAMVIDNGRQVNLDWNGVWDVAARMTDDGWTAEIAIPFSTLKFNRETNQVWGINFERNIRRKNEQVLWQGWSRDSELEQVGRAGFLTGLHNLGGITLTELRPYIKGGAEKSRDERASGLRDVGIDLNYLITPTMKLNLTANTDFAETEVDRVQVNLTRFSLFYPEKRKFFLEGMDFFDFGTGSNIRPFYSRRIGLADDGTNPIPIIGGARLLGRIGASTVGGLLLQTAKRDKTPTTNFGALRYKRDLFGQSTVGIIATTRSESGNFGSTYGLDYLYSTSTLFGDKNFNFGGALTQSFSSVDSPSTGLAHRLEIDYPNDLVEFSAIWDRADMHFDPLVGFMQRTNFQMVYGELQFNPRPSMISWLRYLQFKPFEVKYYTDDATGSLQSLWTEFRPLGFATQKGEYLEFNIQRTAEHITEDFEIYPGRVILPGEYWSTRWELQLSTFEARTLSGYIFVNWGEFYDGNRTVWDGGLTLKASKHFRLGAEYTYNHVHLVSGSFEISEVAGSIEFAPSTRLTNTLFVQWNDEDQRLIANARLHWIPSPGTDFYLVMNQSAGTASASWRSLQTNILAKLVWRFVI